MATVLFDLDGTLINSERGIVDCMQYALQAYGPDDVDDEAIRALIGVPLWGMFSALGVQEVDVEAAVQRYRERYGASGMFDADVYDGVSELLSALVEDGHTLAVATSKLETFAEQTLVHFDLAHHFSVIGGATRDGRIKAKADVIADVLQRLGVLRRDAIMVGDRAEDLEGAAAHGLPAIAVTWGFGSRPDYGPFSPAAVVDSAEELLEALASRA